MTTMDDFEFDSQSFLEYLEPSFASLYTLLREAKECHTKVLGLRLDDFIKIFVFHSVSTRQMNVLYIMGLIIDKMSFLMTNEYAAKLIQYLPMLWDESRDHNLLRCAIISILVSGSKCSLGLVVLTNSFGISDSNTQSQQCCTATFDVIFVSSYPDQYQHQ